MLFKYTLNVILTACLWSGCYHYPKKEQNFTEFNMPKVTQPESGRTRMQTQTHEYYHAITCPFLYHMRSKHDSEGGKKKANLNKVL